MRYFGDAQSFPLDLVHTRPLFIGMRRIVFHDLILYTDETKKIPPHGV